MRLASGLLAAWFLLALPGFVAGQRPSPLRFDLPAAQRALVPWPRMVAVLIPLERPDSQPASRDNGYTVALGSLVGGVLGLGGGVLAGYVLGGPGRTCGDDSCSFIGAVIGGAVGESVGMGVGGYLGGRRRGILDLDILAPLVVGALALKPLVNNEHLFYVIPPAQIRSVILVDRVAANHVP